MTLKQMKTPSKHSLAISRRIATIKAKKDAAREAAHNKLRTAFHHMHWDRLEFEVGDDAKVNPSENNGKWVECYIFVTDKEILDAS